MMLLLRHLRAVGQFYCTVAPASLAVTLLMAGLLLPFREAPNYGVPLLLKLLTWLPLLYLHARLRPQARWWWHNLGYSRRQLWGTVFALDMLLFGLMLGLVFR
ncbi:hypothetical protein [Hymenobacter edaphi]|uniref:Uncharacterized protein n=1 Tax=Hymenobacter edaphi TaxID=2211146 RepID=A0A328B6E5_9BACT|nr:hypothetical protein [Hymenobacter edaphi]RAK62950.1 hypothetical protein DLM85_22395 [Hymenobacter edaphi]